LRKSQAYLHRGLSPNETAFVVKVSQQLVYEYLNLIHENQIDIKEQMGNKEYIDYDDIPF